MSHLPQPEKDHQSGIRQSRHTLIILIITIHLLFSGII